MKKEIKNKEFLVLGLAILIMFPFGCKKSDSTSDTTNPPVQKPALTLYRSTGEAYTMSLLAKYEFSDKTIQCLGNFDDTKIPTQITGIIEQDKGSSSQVVFISSDDASCFYIYEVLNGQKKNILFSIISGTNGTNIMVYDFNWTADTGNLIAKFNFNKKYLKTSRLALQKQEAKESPTFPKMNTLQYLTGGPKIALEEDPQWIKDGFNNCSPSNTQLHTILVFQLANSLSQIGTDLANQASQLWQKANDALIRLRDNSTTTTTTIVETTNVSQTENSNTISLTQDEKGESFVQRSLPVLILKIITGDDQQGSTNEAFPHSVILAVTSKNMTPAQYVTVTIETNHGGKPANEDFEIDANGTITLTWNAGGYVGEQTLKASIKDYSFFDCQPRTVYIVNTVNQGNAAEEYVEYTITGPGGRTNKVSEPPHFVGIGQDIYNSKYMILSFGDEVEIKYYLTNQDTIKTWDQIPCGTYTNSYVNHASQKEFMMWIGYETDTSYYFNTVNNYSWNVTNGSFTISQQGDFLTGTIDSELIDLFHYLGPINNHISGTFKISRSSWLDQKAHIHFSKK
jgi:hypothetical protein